jgi:hypothetical protein
MLTTMRKHMVSRMLLLQLLLLITMEWPASKCASM